MLVQLTGIFVKTPVIYRWMPDFFTAAKKSGIHLSVSQILIGFCLKLFTVNNFRYFPMNKNKNNGNTYQHKKTDPGQSGTVFPF
ncbi:hypothetical protein ACUSJO_001502 [Escherichia albertii]